MIKPIKAAMTAHYTRLIQLPGWRQYVIARVRAMAQECPELWHDLPSRVASHTDQPSTKSAIAAASKAVAGSGLARRTGAGQ